MAARPHRNLTLFPIDDDAAAPPRGKPAKPARTPAAKKKKKSGANAKTGAASAAHRDLEQQLQRALGTKVVLVDKGGRGTITIGWHGYDHLEALRAKLG